MLIEKVRSRAFLYDVKSGDYRDQEMRTNAWEEIGKELKIKPGTAKDTWEKLRRCFMNALSRRRNKKSGDGATQMPPWRFEQEMSFLLPSFSTRKTQSNLQEVDELHKEVVDSPETSTNHRSGYYMNYEVSPSQDTPQTSQGDHIASSKVPNETHVNFQNIANKKKKRDGGDNDIHKMVKIMRENSTLRRIRHEERKISSLDLDDTDMFFLSLAKTAKTLPPLELAKVKLQVSQAVLQMQIALGEQAQNRKSSASPASHNSTSSETSFSPHPISTASAASCSPGTLPLVNDPINSEYLGPKALSSGPSSVPENEVESEPDESEKWIHTVGAEVSSPKMKKRQSKLSEERQNCCDNHANQANQSMIPQKQDDKLNALALAVSKKLRKMDCHQQMYAENVINRALFFGSMGLLTAFSDGHPTSSHNTGSTSSLPPEKQRKLVTRKHPKTPPGPKNAPEELLELTFIKEEPSTSDNEVALYEPTFVDVSVPSTIEDGPFIKSEPPETITAESPDETFSKYSEPTRTQSPQEVQSCMTSKNNSASNTSLRPSEPALEPPPLVLLNKSSPRASISGKSTEQRNPKKKRSLQESNDGNETLPIFQTDVPEAEVRVRIAELQVGQMKKEYEVKMKNQQIIAEQFKKEHEAKMKEHELKMKKVKGQIVEMEFRCQEMMKQSVIENKVHELTVMDLEQKLSTSQIIHELTVQELKQKLYNSQLEQQILEKKLNAHPS
uniref:MADF domain-containing protein n=1 Tax=Timema shepardi TaxID=629360 RepID=A0A7R9AQU9_TIMSH|nr:unnamed protein product [Timema shepardi]